MDPPSQVSVFCAGNRRTPKRHDRLGHSPENASKYRFLLPVAEENCRNYYCLRAGCNSGDACEPKLTHSAQGCYI